MLGTAALDEIAATLRTARGIAAKRDIATVAARLGLLDVAYKMFHHAVHIDLDDNKGNVRDGIHAAACGGSWQAVALGFCGLHLDANGEPAVDPRLPEHWRSLPQPTLPAR